MSSADQDNKLASITKVLAERMTHYRANFFEPLGPQQIQCARQALIDIQNMVTHLEGEWRSYSNVPFSRVFQKLGARVMIDRARTSRLPRCLQFTKQVSRRVMDWLWLTRDVDPQETVMLLGVTRKGYEMLEQLSSLPSYTCHYSEQCDAFAGTPQGMYTKREASEMNASMLLQVERLRDDVNSKQQQILLLNLYSQTALTAHMRRLTVLVLAFTIGVLVATLLILVAGG